MQMNIKEDTYSKLTAIKSKLVQTRGGRPIGWDVVVNLVLDYADTALIYENCDKYDNAKENDDTE